MMYERPDCRLCGGRVETVLSLTPTPIANLFPDEPLTGKAYPLELKQCPKCQHVQIGHVVDDDTLYGATYKYTTPQALSAGLRNYGLNIPPPETCWKLGPITGFSSMRYGTPDSRKSLG